MWLELVFPCRLSTLWKVNHAGLHCNLHTYTEKYHLIDELNNLQGHVSENSIDSILSSSKRKRVTGKVEAVRS